MGFYVAGIYSIIYLYDIHIALSALFVLAYGDPCARFNGIKCGVKRKWLMGKTLEGMLGFISASVIATMFVIGLHSYYPIFPIGMPVERVIFPLFAAIIAGSVVEVYSGRFDNLVIPVVVGGVLKYLIELFMR